MRRLVGSVMRAIHGRSPTPGATFTRAQARRLLHSALDPLLEREGFAHRKGNCVWRVADDRSDVIELRFLTLAERRQFELPESTFSLLYGCYYDFIPDIHDGRFAHQIPGLLTPREVDCHYRSRAMREIEQAPKKLDRAAWHLDEPRATREAVLADVIGQLESRIFPKLSMLADVREWVRFLEEDEEGNLGTGRKGSVTRAFLLAFSLRFIGDDERARHYMLDAQHRCEEHLETLAAVDVQASDSAKRLERIRSALAG